MMFRAIARARCASCPIQFRPPWPRIFDESWTGRSLSATLSVLLDVTTVSMWLWSLSRWWRSCSRFTEWTYGWTCVRPCKLHVDHPGGPLGMRVGRVNPPGGGDTVTGPGGGVTGRTFEPGGKNCAMSVQELPGGSAAVDTLRPEGDWFKPGGGWLHVAKAHM